MKRKSKVYRCYSVPQKEFLTVNGLEYLDALKDDKGKTLWVFLKCNELDNLLTQWSNNNPNKCN